MSSVSLRSQVRARTFWQKVFAQNSGTADDGNTPNGIVMDTSENNAELTYEVLQKEFSWELPEDFNIATSCLRHAKDPGRLALIYDKGRVQDEKWTFFELDQTSNRLAHALNSMGVARQSRVAIFLSQSPELVISHFAVYKLGAIAVPLFVLFGLEAVRHRLKDSETTVVVTDESHVDIILALRPDLPHLKAIIVTDKKVSGTAYWEDVIEGGSNDFESAVTGPSDPAIIIYTSGTTGSPKGALHGHRILLGHLPGVSLPHNLAPDETGLFWTPADWAWIGGLFDVLFPALFWGIPILAHRMGKFDAERAFTLMEKWGVTNVFLPPTAIKMMRQVEEPKLHYTLHIRTMASGGEPLGDETHKWAQNELGVAINEFYGQTECNVVLGNCNALFPAKANSTGKPIPGHEVAILSEEAQLAEDGLVGEIIVRAPDPVMFLRYWNRPDATQDKLIDLTSPTGNELGTWLRTGDLAYRDMDGYFHFVGRSDDIISSGGYRIGPAEIEEVLMQHPSVLMAAVVGTPDPVRGESVKAFIQLKKEYEDGDTASNNKTSSYDGLKEDLQNWVKQHLAAYEYPRDIEFVDSFPMTPSGKIRRNVLRQREHNRGS